MSSQSVQAEGASGSWLEWLGQSNIELERDLGLQVRALVQERRMPEDEQQRVAKLSTAIAKGAFVVTPERLELLRGLCQIYSAGIRAERISSHRRYLGPLIVFFKKALFRVISALLGPTFSYQRDFNAGVIRLLGDLCNESDRATGKPASL